MTDLNLERIIDGDGHIMEDFAGIAKMIPYPYNQGVVRADKMFPYYDHLHRSNQVKTSADLAGRGRVGSEEWFDFLTDVHIDTTVLYPTAGLAYGRIVSVDWAIATCRAYNDWLSETYMARSPRFKGMALIPGQDVEAAVEELRRVVEDLGMPGAMLPAKGFDTHMGAKTYWPIYAEADRLGCAIAFHGGSHDMLGMDRLNRYAPIHGIGHPLSVMIAFAGVVFNGVMDRYPNARYAFLEGGVAWTMMGLERFDRSHETHPEFDPFRQWGPQADEKVSDYIIKHIKDGRLHFGIEGDEPLLPHAVKALGEEAWVYSSDFPHEVTNEMCKAEIQEVLDNEGLTDSAREAILHKNGERLYRLAMVTA
ncbi:MAG: putative metal-dependent hydrolase, TIM-barrel fold [Chloroflexi bacterium]|nr:MAG: putative metal-dependent hydrolase, TIM-barrel fold [Chloroflexota bacterium]